MLEVSRCLLMSASTIGNVKENVLNGTKKYIGQQYLLTSIKCVVQYI